MDPLSLQPELILELDDENLIIKFQNSKVDDEFSKGLECVAIGNLVKNNNKEVNLLVVSTVEESKVVEYRFNELNTFKYKVTALSDIDCERIFDNVKSELETNQNFTNEETICSSC